ncbi:4161_t:CDS:2, partial [Gigaspora margarita]
NVTISRVEGAHAMLKTYLQVLMGNLHIVHEKISLVIENQYQEIKTKSSQEIIRIPQAQNNQFYAQQHQLSQQEPFETENSLHQKWENFSHQFTFLSIYQKNTTLERISSLFQELTVIIQDLEIQHTRGYPAGTKNCFQSSTKRDPSTFELIISRKCGICHEARHNSKTCPNTEIDSLDENSHTRRCGICCETRYNSRICPNIESSNEYS